MRPPPQLSSLSLSLLSLVSIRNAPASSPHIAQPSVRPPRIGGRELKRAASRRRRSRLHRRPRSAHGPPFARPADAPLSCYLFSEDSGLNAQTDCTSGTPGPQEKPPNFIFVFPDTLCVDLTVNESYPVHGTHAHTQRLHSVSTPAHPAFTPAPCHPHHQELQRLWRVRQPAQCDAQL